MGMFDNLNFNETEEEKKRRKQQEASQQDGGYFNDLTFQPATPTPTQKPQEHTQPAAQQQQQQPSFLDNIKNNIVSGAQKVGDFLNGEYQQVTHPNPKQQQNMQTAVPPDNNSDSSAQMTITPQSLQYQRQAAQAAKQVTEALSSIFQGTINQMQSVEDDPIGLKNLDDLMKDPKKVMDKVLSTTPQAYQAIGQNVQELKQDRDNKAPLSKTIGDELKALSSQANFVFSPINTLFNAADSLPILGSVTKLITAPFVFVGEGATAISNKVIDTLPIPQQAKENLKPGVGEIFSLASQVVLGHTVAGDAMDKLTNKYGVTDAKTIVDTAFDLAKENKKEFPEAPAAVEAATGDTAPQEVSFTVKPNNNLTPEQKVVESKLTDYVTKNTEDAITKYSTLPDSEGGRVLNTDVARELSPDYQKDRSMSSSVHEPASGFIKELYKRKLAETDPDGKNTVLFTAGGTGSGKSTAISGIPQMKAIADNAQIVYDTNMASANPAIQKIQQALDAGKQVVIGYVHRDPTDALVNGALPRAMRMGRTVPMEAHVDTHVGAPDALLQVAEHFKGNDNVDIQVIDNSLGRGNAKIVDLEKLATLGYNKDELRVKLDSALEEEYKNGRISEQVYNGFKNDPVGNRINGETIGPADGGSNGQQSQQTNEAARATAPPATDAVSTPQHQIASQMTGEMRDNLNQKTAGTNAANAGLSDTVKKIYEEHGNDYHIPEKLYHGAPSKEAAADIVKNGFKKGNNYGGVSLTASLDEAMDYAGGDKNRIVTVTNDGSLKALGEDGKDILTGEFLIHPELLNKVKRESSHVAEPPADQGNVTFQSKVAREKQAEFTTQLEKLGNESKNGEEQAGKVSDFVGQVLNTSHDDPASVMGLRTALNKEMLGIVGNNGSFKKNYAMLKYMQASDSPQAHYLSTLEDHIALIDDVIRGKAMDDFARTFGNVPADLPAAPEQAGGSVTLGAGPNPGIDKFIKDDAVPYAKDTVNGMKKVFDEVRTWLAPVTKVPKEALDVIMTHKGEMERQQFRVEQATKDISKMWDKQDDNSRLKFMHDVETDNVTNPKFKPIADFYRERLDAAHQVINNYKNINFIENFFPHFWEKPEDVQKFLARQASRRPLEGSKSFLKERVFETIKEGMEAGYTPVSTNPEEIMQIYENNVRKFQMAQEIKADLLDKGFWKFVRAGDKAPEGFAPVNDRIAKIYFPPDITEVTVNGSEVKKMIEAGEYHAQEDVARIINNYLSPDFIRDTALGKGFMNMKNTMNAFEMGLSAFHGTMETFDSIITHGSIGLSRIFNEGKVMKGLQDIFTSPSAPVKYFRDGQKFFNGDPELTKIENDLFTGGASLQNHQYFKNTVYDTFLQRVREGNVLGAAVRTPLATIEAAMRPLMSYYIPRLKIGAFRHQFGAELERNSQLIQDGKLTREELARKTWSNIENRMGELNYDNLFWNRTMKASLMLSLRAVGWNLGTAREIGGGVFADAPAQVVNMVKLQRPELTPKMAYTLNLLFTTAAASSVYQYLHTGKAPTNLLDMFYPQNGSTDKNGNPVRVQFPTYLKDMYAASHHPIKMVGDKLAPELTTLISLLNNKDYYGNYIRNEHDNLPTQTKQLGAYLINQMAPFSIQGVQQQAQGKASIPAQLENFLGIQKAPIDTMKTDKEHRLQDAATAQLGAMGPQTPEEQHISQLKAQARKDVVAGTPLRQSAAFMELVKSGTIKTRLQAENFVRDAGKTPDQRLFQHLSNEKKKEVLQIK